MNPMGFGIIEKYVRGKMGTARPVTDYKTQRNDEKKPASRGPIWIKDSIEKIHSI